MNCPWEHFDQLQPGQLVHWEPRYDGHPRDKLDPGEIWTVVDRRTADDGATVVQFQRPNGKREHRAITGPGVLLIGTVGEHHAVCCVCSQPWPCGHYRRDREADAYARRLNDACVVCGQTDGVRWGTVRRELGNGEVSEERYHTRKGSQCRRAYLRLIAGDERALTALRFDDACRGGSTR
jgi:hypothetical protein